jgi:hypothetical protein
MSMFACPTCSASSIRASIAMRPGKRAALDLDLENKGEVLADKLERANAHLSDASEQSSLQYILQHILKN